MSKKKAVKKKAAKAPPVKKATKKKTAAPAKPAKKKGAKKKAAVKMPSLGRPKVTADEKLFLLFKEDHHARSIFEFLRAETVRDLEQFSPKEIVDRLSQPIKTTVERIRLKLADKNRYLKDDLEFALGRQAEE